MKYKTLLLLVVLASLTVGLVWSQQMPTVRSNEKAKAYLDSLEYFVGEWTGKGEMPGMGMAFTDTIRCKWMFDKQFLKMKYEAKSGDMVMWQDMTLSGWDSDAGRPTQYTFSMDGSIGEASSYRKEEGKTILEGHTSGPTPFKDWHTETVIIDKDHFKISMSVKKGDTYETFLTSEYSRSADKKKKESE